MDSVSLDRRLAAASVVPLLVAAFFVTVQSFFAARIVGYALGGVLLLAWGGWWWLTEVGVRRKAAPVLAVVGIALLGWGLTLTVTRTLSTFTRPLASAALVVLAFWLLRHAFRRPTPTPWFTKPERPVLLCNPWSGGGKVAQFDLVARAEALGVEVVVMDESSDLEQLARDAVARGADCLGMAGGDGSQALVASVAVEHGLPFVCIPAGTRNHLALDLGLDRTDPGKALVAFAAGVERSIDYATVNDQLFVNNVSLGIYAEIVQSDEYRDNKTDVSLKTAAEMLGREAQPFDLDFTTPDGAEIDDAFIVMVSNNRYELRARTNASQRNVLDAGRLGIIALTSSTGAQAARLASLIALGMPDLSSHWHEFSATEFEVRSNSGTAFYGQDGEALTGETPMRFAIHPKGLRMLVPPDNPDIAERRRVRSGHLRDLWPVILGREPDVDWR